MNEQLERIALFLGQYFEVDDGVRHLREPLYQKDAIRQLIEKHIMTADEIRMEAVRDFNVIIPAAYFDL